MQQFKGYSDLSASGRTPGAVGDRMDWEGPSSKGASI